MRAFLPLAIATAVAACDGSLGSKGAPACDAGGGQQGGHDASTAGDSGVDAAPEPELDAGLDTGIDSAPEPTRCPVAPFGPPLAVYPAPPPDGSGVVWEVATERPDLLAGSCVKTGGNNEFLFEVIRRLRTQDDRWGLNWKRGNEGDMSQDVADYFYGEGPCEGSTDVYIIDIIGGHCGDAPAPAWIDVTQATLDGGTIGRWTLAGQDL